MPLASCAFAIPPMVFFDTKKERAALIVLLLAVGLAVALGPYVSGLLGAPVLYVLFHPMHRWLARKMPPGSPRWWSS